MPWHPPIPAEVVYRPEVATLGAGLRLLLYCYNCVGRDGAFTLSLAQATDALGVEYETLRKWWQALKKTQIVTVVKDMGHKGLHIKMHPDWIDWHVQSNNFQRENITVEEPLSGPQRENITAQPSLNGSSTSPQRENITVEPNAYKVLMSSDQERGSEDRDGTARTLSHPAIAAYRKAFPDVSLNQKQAAVISALVGERADRLECWQEVIQDYELSPHWKPENIGNLRSRFEKKLLARVDTKPADTRPPLPVVQPKPDAVDAAASRKALQEAAQQLRRGHS